MPTDCYFPHFKSVDYKDKVIFASYLNKFKSYSDFNLLSLLSWNINKNNSFSILKNNLVIKVKDYLGESFKYSIIGGSDIDESLYSLFEIIDRIDFVPEDVINKIEFKDNYIIEEDRDSFDYIIDVKEVCACRGNRYKNLRHAVNKFTNSYKDYEVIMLDIASNSTIDSLKHLNQQWFESKSFDLEKQNEETLILDNFVKYSKHFNCVLLGLFVGGKLAAYTFNEVLPDKTIMGHFGASDYNILKSSSFIEYKTAEHFYKLGYSIINLQQDTGLLNLRETKMIYSPIYFLRKFCIRLSKR